LKTLHKKLQNLYGERKKKSLDHGNAYTNLFLKLFVLAFGEYKGAMVAADRRGDVMKCGDQTQKINSGKAED